MRGSCLEREIPTGVEEDHDDMNEADILGFTDDELAKYKKMIEDSKKPFYHGCASQYVRLFVMVKFFQLKANNG
jgi:hypothetical protein